MPNRTSWPSSPERGESRCRIMILSRRTANSGALHCLRRHEWLHLADRVPDGDLGIGVGVYVDRHLEQVWTIDCPHLLDRARDVGWLLHPSSGDLIGTCDRDKRWRRISPQGRLVATLEVRLLELSHHPMAVVVENHHL